MSQWNPAQRSATEIPVHVVIVADGYMAEGWGSLGKMMGIMEKKGDLLQVVPCVPENMKWMVKPRLRGARPV